MMTAKAVLEVTLTAPPPPDEAEEERESKLLVLPGGGLHGSPLRSEPRASWEDVAGMGSERPVVARAPEVVEISSDDEADVVAELPASSRQLAVVRSEAGPSGGLPEGDLEWPYPEDPVKARFVL